MVAPAIPIAKNLLLCCALVILTESHVVKMESAAMHAISCNVIFNLVVDVCTAHEVRMLHALVPFRPLSSVESGLHGACRVVTAASRHAEGLDQAEAMLVEGVAAGGGPASAHPATAAEAAHVAAFEASTPTASACGGVNADSNGAAEAATISEQPSELQPQSHGQPVCDAASSQQHSAICRDASHHLWVPSTSLLCW